MSLFSHSLVKFTLSVWLLVVISACSSTALRPQTHDHLAVPQASQAMLKKSAQAVVYLSQGYSAFNGVLVSNYGLVLSVSHGLLKPGHTIYARLMDGRITTAKLMYNNPEFDIAILQLEHFSGGDFLSLNPNITENQPVYALGRHRLIGSLKVSKGVVKTAWINLANMEVSNLNIDNMAVQNAIFHNATIEQGFSGGPLVNAKGELVAINSSILDAKGKPLAIALSVDNFIPLIEAITDNRPPPSFPNLDTLEDRIDFLLAGLSRHARQKQITPDRLKLISLQIKQTALQLNKQGNISEQQLSSWVWNGFLEKLRQ